MLEATHHQAPYRGICLAIVIALSAGLATGCESAPAEPTNTKPRATAKPIKQRQLQWAVPPTWTTMRTANKGEYRGKYQIPKTGDAKHQPELLVTYLGKGKKADIPARLAEWRADFEGDNIANAKVVVVSAAGDIQASVLELHGTYKFPLGPPMGKKQRRAATMLKKNWRGFGAAVKTPDRGTYFFQLVGPNDAVAAAKADFMAMMKALK